VLFVIGALVLRASIVHAGSAPRVEQLSQKGEKLLAGDATEAAGEEAHFGSSAALSSDGSTLLVGAPGDDKARGAAWVFKRGAESTPGAEKWEPQGGKLTPGELEPPSGGEGCKSTPGSCEECAEEPKASPAEEGECAFGASVALSADGNTAIVGNPTSSSSPGAAWIFTRSESGAWARSAKLSGANTPRDGRFGRSVALSADGDVALVGDPSAANGRGSAWVFEREGSSWTAIGEISGAGAGAFAHFGRSVALSGDGSLALIGAPGEDEFAGAAWTFTRNGSIWTRQANEVTEQGAKAGDHFGKSVALSADGSTALIGALEAEEGLGSASPFVTSPEGLIAQGTKFVGPAGEQHFGASVALSGDGNLALVGAPRATASGGTVAELTRSESTWMREGELLSGSGAKSRSMFGAAVALSSDGDVAAVGSSRDSGRLGAAWVFAQTPEALVPAPIVEGIEPRKGPAAGGTAVKISGQSLGRATAISFGETPAASIERISATEVAAVSPPGTGKVDVTVSTASGTSEKSSKDTFVYEAGDPASPNKTTTTTTTTTTQRPSGGVAGSISSSGAACSVSVRKKRLAVTRYRTVALRLTRTGTGSCRGKLAISYRVKAKGRGYALRTIGTASFSIAAGQSKVVNVKLTKSGQAWFRAHRGKANASVAIARVVPAPITAHAASVRLSLKKAAKRAHAK
jgi:IPT/TIG domain/FG-GAP repeat